MRSNGIDVKERVFAGVVARSLCERTYGGKISDDAWGNWRKWIKIPSYRREYTFQELCWLYAIAKLRSNPKNRYRQLGAVEINEIAKSLDTHEMIESLIHMIDESGIVLGKDAALALAANGVNVSTRTLYRNVPGFSTNKTYKVKELKEWAIA